jgi:hypothetical protein
VLHLRWLQMSLQLLTLCLSFAYFQLPLSPAATTAAVLACLLLLLQRHLLLCCCCCWRSLHGH